MNFRCNDCGFVQDFEPTAESMALNYPEITIVDFKACPSCVREIKRGKREKEPGALIAE